MKTARFRLPALLLGATLVLLSCGEPAPVGPELQLPAPQADLIGSLLGGTGLLSCRPLAYASATQTVGPSGGVIYVGPHVLSIPAGALSAPVTITAISPSERVNRINFQPAGLVFQKAATLAMSYSNCSLLGKLLPKHIAYTDDSLNILSYLLSLDNLFAKRVTGQLNHFSNYAVAW